MGPGGSYAQFLSYLQFGISSMTNLEYWFDKRKIDGTTNESKTAVIKQKFQQMILQNGALTQRGEEIFNAIWTNVNLARNLFGEEINFN